MLGKSFNAIEAWYPLDHIDNNMYQDNNMHQVNNIPQGQLYLPVDFKYILAQCLLFSFAFFRVKHRYTKLSTCFSLTVLFATCNIIQAISLFMHAQAGVRINQKYMRFILLELVGFVFFSPYFITRLNEYEQ